VAVLIKHNGLLLSLFLVYFPSLKKKWCHYHTLPGTKHCSQPVYFDSNFMPAGNKSTPRLEDIGACTNT
jgi:hypothetical protein